MRFPAGPTMSQCKAPLLPTKKIKRELRFSSRPLLRPDRSHEESWEPRIKMGDLDRPDRQISGHPEREEIPFRPLLRLGA